MSAQAVTRSQLGIATYLAPHGPLADADSIGSLRDSIRQAREASEMYIVIDMANVSTINSAALEVLLDAQDQLVRQAGHLKLCNTNTIVESVLEITGIDRLIDSVDAASHYSDSPPGPDSTRQQKRIGDILIERELISASALQTAITQQDKTGKRLGALLIEQKLISEADFLSALAQQMNLPFARLRTGLYDPEACGLVSPKVARKLKVLPLFKVHDTVFLATSDAYDMPSFDTVEEIIGATVKPVLATPEDILRIIDESQSGGDSLSEYITSLDVEDDLELVEEKAHDYTSIDEIATGSPVINLINGLVQRAVRDGASDIHIEPSPRRCRIRFRIDGVLYHVMSPPEDIFPALVSRLKVMANLDIAERRMPQDGRIQVYTQGRTIDLRFSSLPSIAGEKVVLRVLDKSQTVMRIDKLGMTSKVLDQFKSLLGFSNGLLLVTGPTGSGKTTTLYAAINELSSVEKSVVTIEDPVEYQVDAINQNQVREGIGLGFATILKHVLRQDPDIVMVGEIRERETAEIAVQAALTGHLVLSTLHTNDSIGAITRMIDMGVPAYLLSSALIGVVAQRLIRTICSNCHTSYTVSGESLREFGIDRDDQVKLYKGRGCPACYDSGYKGRIAIHEVFDVTHATQQLMVSKPSRDVMMDHIRERGITTLFDSGMANVLAGNTTIDEVLRVTGGAYGD